MSPSILSSSLSSSSASLARRFQQNWLAQHPQDNNNNNSNNNSNNNNNNNNNSQSGGCNLDDSLTSLGWLQNLKVSEITQPRQTSSPCLTLENNRNFVKQEPPESPPPLLHLQTSKMEPRIQVGDMAPSCGSSPDSIDYKSNPFVKPPYSYASLICMAMKATKKNKITLSSIYNWITDNFMYYRLTDPSWQNSIRHNLSLNKCFEKVARRKDEPGKGGFWRINPDYGDMVENGVFKKRRNSRDIIPSPPPKRYKLDDDDFPSISGMKCSAREDKLLSNGSLNDLSFDDDDDDKTLALKGDFNWTSILSQDIDIGGRKIKTEVILDEAENSPFMAMSPPSSETNSDDLGLDDLFSQTDFAMNSVDFQTNDPLDLTVQGTTIRPPEWWSSDANNINNMNNVHNHHNEHHSGLNTPVPPSPESDHGGDTMWGEGLNLGTSGNFSSGNFVLDNLFDIDNIPSPQL